MITKMNRDSGSLQVLTTASPDLWRSILPANQSVFGSLDFAVIAEEYVGHPARLIVVTTDKEVVAYPLFLRPISALAFASCTNVRGWDCLSPEYTGPLACGKMTQETAFNFRNSFAEYCRQEGIVTEFAHLHPWNKFPDLVGKEGVSFDREIVFVDLTIPEEQMWKDCFTHACRKNLARAKKENVEVFQASSPQDIQHFYRIYTHTMDRRGSLSKYYFPLGYFMELFERIPNNAVFFLARYQNQVIAATLYLHDDVDMYSYLGGADYTFQSIRPSNAVVHEAIRWGQSRGKKRLILGGSYQPDDGIFRFKSSFSPFRACFRVYKHIHLPHEYHELGRAWADHYAHDVPSNGYFPAYRSVPS